MMLRSLIAILCLLTSTPCYAVRGAGAPPVLVSTSASTASLTWTSGSAGPTTSACGTTVGTYPEAAVDNGTQTSVTAHASMVAGLLPSTTYWCQAQDGTNTYIVRAITLPAPVTTPINSLTISAASEPVPDQISADTFHNCISNDNVTYVTSDDTLGWGNATSSNMMFGKFTTETPLTGTNVNTMAAFGTQATDNGDDNRSPKLAGIYCLGGNLYGSVGRQTAPGGTGSPSFGIYNQTSGSVVKSTDHGVSWSDFKAPTTYSTSGSVPSPASSLMFPTTTALASAAFVEYGPDDGTLGYRVDNADAFVYTIATDTNWDNGNNLYEARVPRAWMPSLSGSKYQYYTGGDCSLDSSWSSSYSAAVPILSATGQISFPSMQYIPSTGRYLLFEWHYPDATITNTSVWVVYEAPHQCGPFTQIPINGTATKTWNPQGFYNPSTLMRSALTATRGGSPITLMFSGDYTVFNTPSGYYHFNTATAVIN